MSECCTPYEQGGVDATGGSNAMGGSTIPKRVVLRFNVEYELEEYAINNSFFTRVSYELQNDYFSHLMAANNSSKMHIVLDLRCTTNPTIDNREIPYEVYSVYKKDGVLYVTLELGVSQLTKQQISEFEQLNSNACDLARERCKRVGWGTHRTQSDELDGVLASHAGHLPPTFVS
jgi:hypothetical protein